MLCEVGKVDDRLTGVVPYPTFLTISGFQAATLAALSASNGWAAETVLLAEPLLAIVGIPVDLVLVIVVAPPAGQDGAGDVVPHGEEGGRHGSEWVGCEGGQGQGCAQNGVLHADFEGDAFCCA